MDNDLIKTKQIIRRELADFLGIATTDIEDDTFFSEDLHMNPTDMTDYVEILGKAGFSVGDIDLTEVETFDDLAELLNDKHL